MLNKNDPLIGAVQEVMKKNQAERDAVKLVNEKFGVVDRKALPHERQGEWDAAYKRVLSEGVDPSKYSEKQKKIARIAGNPNKIDSKDLSALRNMEEGQDPYAENEGGSAISTVTVKPKPKSVTPADQKALTDKISTIKERDEGAPGLMFKKIAAKAAKRYGSIEAGNRVAGAIKQKKREAGTLEEKAPPGAKYERMVKHIKAKLGKDGLTDKEKAIAYATAWKAKNNASNDKTMNEGITAFSDASKDVAIAARKLVPQNTNMAGSALDQTLGARPEVSRDNRLRLARISAGPLDPNRDKKLDNPITQSNMALAQNPNINGAGGGNYASAVTKKDTQSLRSKVDNTPSPKVDNTPSPKVTQTTSTSQPDYDKMSFKDAFKAARQQAGGASGKFTYKGKEYQTNIQGTGTAKKPQEKYLPASKLKKVAPAAQTTTKTSVVGGHGIGGISSNSTNKPRTS